jgi:hypothetical protein
MTDPEHPSYDYEPDPEPLPPPAKLVRDYLTEAVAVKNQLLELMRLMRPIERQQLRRVLSEEINALNCD